MSKIEWTEKTWCPGVYGCDPVSAGCRRCYAASFARRLAGMGRLNYAEVVDSKGWNGKIVIEEESLKIPLERKKPTIWFVGSMTDLFHPAVPVEHLDKVFAVMALCPQHIFQILTKRPKRMYEYLSGQEDSYETMPEGVMPVEAIYQEMIKREGVGCLAPNWPMPNVWVGTSAEDQKNLDERLHYLEACPARVRYLSIEPLLDRIFKLRLDHIHWVIVGGESGAGAVRPHVDHVRWIRDCCLHHGVPFFFKQWGGPNKAEAGRLLDGVEWSQMPDEAWIHE